MLPTLTQSLSEERAGQYPYNCIGFLTFKTKDKSKGLGTGFLIDADLVLTAAFNVYDKKSNQCYAQLKFYPGVSGQLRNPLTIIGVRFCPQFKVCNQKDKINYQYALLKLDRPMHYHQYLPLSVTPTEKVQSIGLFGYIGSFQNNQSAIQTGYWSQTSFIVDNCIFYHNLQAQPGNGGSPILCKKGSEIIVLAIHQGGYYHKKQHKITKLSRLITADLIQNIKTWSEQMRIHKKQEPSNKYEEIIAEKDKQLKMLRKANQQYKIQVKYQKEKIQQLNNQFSVISNIKGTAKFMDQSFQHLQFINYKDEMSMDPSSLLCHKCQSKEDEADEQEEKLKLKFKQRIQTLQKEKKQMSEVIADKEGENLELNEQNTKLKKKLKKYEN